VKSKFLTFILAAGLALASGNGFGAGSDASANLRLMAFGGDAQLKAVTNAVARYNQKYPNVKVEIGIDPITSGWGDYVTRASNASWRMRSTTGMSTATILTSKSWINGMRQVFTTQISLDTIRNGTKAMTGGVRGQWR
jgi:hypothetical protein